MRSPTILTTRSRRRALSRRDVLLLAFVVAALGFCSVPWLQQARQRERVRRTQCADNLRGVLMGFGVYSNDNDDWFPQHYYEPAADESGPLPDHGVTWVGTMGSNADLRISELTDADFSPHAGHPSRSLFMLVWEGTCTTNQFVCPSSGDRVDDLRNHGPDKMRPRSPFVVEGYYYPRHDFRGYTYLSYGYQLPYGPHGRPTKNLSASMVVLADKGPYYEAGGEGLPGSETVRDQRSSAQPPSGVADELLGQHVDSWSPYNSPLHGGAGQNVAYVDAHVSFEYRPCIGANFDNIYTIQNAHTLAGAVSGMVPDAHQTIGPFTNTDSFIVP